MRTILATLLLLILPGVVQAQVYQLRTDVRVCTLVNCRVEHGTGSSVCIGSRDNRWYFVSAGHCFFNKDKSTVRSQLLNAYVSIGKEWRKVKVHGFDKPGTVGDLAVISLEWPEPLACRPICERLPPPGAEVCIGGFPGGGQYNDTKGSITKVNVGPKGAYIQVLPGVVRGVSGGPVLCDDPQQVAGIVSGSNFGNGTWATSATVVRERVVETLGFLPDCGKPRREVPPQSESHAEPEKYHRVEKEPEADKPQAATPPPAPPSEAPDIAGAVATAASGKAWDLVWPALAGALGISGPLGIGVYLAGRLIAKRIAPRVVERVKDRFDGDDSPRPQPDQPAPQPAPQPQPPSDNTVYTLPREAQRQVSQLKTQVEVVTKEANRLREQNTFLENEASKVRQYVDLPVDSGLERMRRAMDIVATEHARRDPSFLRWHKLVEDHYGLLLSGDGVTQQA